MVEGSSRPSNSQGTDEGNVVCSSMQSSLPGMITETRENRMDDRAHQRTQQYNARRLSPSRSVGGKRLHCTVASEGSMIISIHHSKAQTPICQTPCSSYIVDDSLATSAIAFVGLLPIVAVYSGEQDGRVRTKSHELFTVAIKVQH
jgi:hypothetical protein